MLFSFPKQDIWGGKSPEQRVSTGRDWAPGVAAKHPVLCTGSFEGVSMGVEPMDEKYWDPIRCLGFAISTTFNSSNVALSMRILTDVEKNDV